MNYIRYVVFTSVAIAAFGVGVLVTKIFSGYRAEPPDMSSVESLRDDEWHRLYEAAGMTGDSTIRLQVWGRFQCMGSDHSLTSRPIETPRAMVSLDKDGSTRPLILKHDDVTSRILKTHAAWSLKNLDFIRSISNAPAARAYVYSHLTNQD